MAPDILRFVDLIAFRLPVTRTRLGASADILGLERPRMMLAGLDSSSGIVASERLGHAAVSA